MTKSVFPVLIFVFSCFHFGVSWFCCSYFVSFVILPFQLVLIISILRAVSKISRQSLGKCSHKIKGVCKCQWCWLAENPRTVCQRTPMDDRTDADAYPWGQFHVCWWTEESPWTLQGIWWLLSRSLCPVVLLVLLYHWIFCDCRMYRDDDCTML